MRKQRRLEGDCVGLGWAGEKIPSAALHPETFLMAHLNGTISESVSFSPGDAHLTPKRRVEANAHADSQGDASDSAKRAVSSCF